MGGDLGKEACSLSPDLRERILTAEREVGQRNHWEVLGLSGSPTKEQVRQAYLRASKQYHPDRFFGEQLGAFADRLQRVFLALKRAHDVLSDPARRTLYERKCPPPEQPPPPLDQPLRRSRDPGEARGGGGSVNAGESEEARERRLEARRQQILAERRRRRRPEPGKAASAAPSIGLTGRPSAEKIYDDAMELVASGELKRAATLLKVAVGYDPRNATYRRKLDEVEAALGRGQSK